MSSNPFADLSKSLERFCAAMDAAIGFDWTATSPAAKESEDEEYADEWAERPARDAALGVRALCTSSLNHLRALVCLLPADQIVYPLFTVARGAVEVSAQAHYLAEPGIGARERVRRHMNMRLVSLNEQRLLVETFIEGPHERKETREALTYVERRTARVLRSAERQGFPVKKPKNKYLAPYIGDQPPTSRAVIEDAVSQNTQKLGTVYWQYLSAIAHGTEYGLAGFISEVGPTGDPRQGDKVGAIQIDSEQAARNLFSAPLSAISMMGRVLHLMGTDPESISGDVHVLMQVWGRVARIPFPDPGVSS